MAKEKKASKNSKGTFTEAKPYSTIRGVTVRTWMAPPLTEKQKKKGLTPKEVDYLVRGLTKKKRF